MSNVHEPSTCGIAIVGAGAAGLAAAIAAAERAKPADAVRILLLDGAHTLGAKILVSGGGRCNVTHEVVTPTDFFGNRRIIKNVLAACSVEQTIAWFTSLGADLKREETGKLFPVTNKSRAVLNSLIERCRQLGVEIRPDHRVHMIERAPGKTAEFQVQHTHGTVVADRLILLAPLPGTKSGSHP